MGGKKCGSILDSVDKLNNLNENIHIEVICLEQISLGRMYEKDSAYAEPQEQEMTAVKSTDNTIFKTAQLRPDYRQDEYRLAKYDIITIMALGHTEDIGDNEITIGVDGMAALPYVGNVKLAGLTLDEARRVIYTKLSQYYKLPELSVSIKSYGARKVYVMGNVQLPGIKEMNVDNMNTYAAISSAGGVDNRGRSKHIQLIRQIDGVLYYREINIDAFVKKHDLSQNIQLEDGDIV